MIRPLGEPDQRAEHTVFPVFHFEAYSAPQMGEVLDVLAAEAGIALPSDSRAEAVRVLLLARDRGYFGNAGDIARLLHRAVKEHVRRLGDEAGAIPLTVEDMRSASVRAFPERGARRLERP